MANPLVFPVFGFYGIRRDPLFQLEYPDEVEKTVTSRE